MSANHHFVAASKAIGHHVGGIEMSEAALPTTSIEGHEICRLVIGTNWFLGHTHQTAAKSKWLNRYQTPEKIARVLEICTAGGMNALVAPIDQRMIDALALHRERTGRHIIQMLTPGGANNDELKAGIDRCAELGAEFCLPHVSWTDARVHPATNEITDYPEIAEHIRGKGMIPGLSTHRPETITVGDRAGYDIAVYIQPINPIGFLCSVETDWVARIINQTPKPVIAIKTMAAGRINPPTGLGFAFANIKPIDMVCVGMMCEEEAEEDLEVARQILARQRVEVELQYTRSKAVLVDGGA